MPSTSELEFDAQVRLSVLEGFLRGQHPSVASVASVLGAPAPDVAAAFARLGAGRAFVLVPGTSEIRMAAPFSGVRTDFRVRVAERSYYANCIWDALGIPAMLAGVGRPADASIETRCLDCAESLTLRVDAGHVSAEPPQPVAHFVVPASRWWDDIVHT
jgi:hypothetical protein